MYLENLIMAKKLKRVSVRTLPNGYSLDFDGMKAKGGFMYYTLDDLLKGFMLHIGLNITEQLNMQNIDDFLETAMNWRENRKCVAEIERLNIALRTMTGKRNSMANHLVKERNRHIKLIEEVNKISDECKDPKTRKALKDVLRGRITMRPINLKSLGIDSKDIIDDESEEEDEE